MAKSPTPEQIIQARLDLWKQHEFDPPSSMPTWSYIPFSSLGTVLVKALGQEGFVVTPVSSAENLRREALASTLALGKLIAVVLPISIWTGLTMSMYRHGSALPVAIAVPGALAVVLAYIFGRLVWFMHMFVKPSSRLRRKWAAEQAEADKERAAVEEAAKAAEEERLRAARAKLAADLIGAERRWDPTVSEVEFGDGRDGIDWQR